MMNILKIATAFLISLLPLTTITSQNISTTTSTDTLITITPTQLKEINLIFNEHHSLLKEKDFLLKKVSTQENIIKNQEEVDSLRVIQLDDCKLKTNQLEIDKKNLQKQLKKKKIESTICKWLAGGSLLTAIILCLQ